MLQLWLMCENSQEVRGSEGYPVFFGFLSRHSQSRPWAGISALDIRWGTWGTPWFSCCLPRGGPCLFLWHLPQRWRGQWPEWEILCLPSFGSKYKFQKNQNQRVLEPVAYMGKLTLVSSIPASGGKQLFWSVRPGSFSYFLRKIAHGAAGLPPCLERPLGSCGTFC